MSLFDRLGRSLFVALAVGLGWGIRGDFGHLIGAMYPGACLGLGWVFVAGSPALRLRMPTIAALTAAAIGAGGMMSYGILHGYAQADTVENYTYGFFTLFCQGGCWGTFGCALAGLLCDRKPMRSGDWIGLVASVFLGGWVTFAVVVDLLKFHVNPPRNDISVAFLGAAIGQFLWLATRDRPAGLRGAVLGFVGFGLGMAGGRLAANVLVAAGVPINHWNVMEMTCGFVGGGVFTFGMLGLGRVEPADEPESFRTPNILGAVYVLGIIPLWHLATKVTPERMEGWKKTLTAAGFTEPGVFADGIFAALVAVCVVAAAGSVAWAGAIGRGQPWPACLPVLFLSYIMLLFQNLAALYFWYPKRPDYWNTHNVFWVLFGLMVLYTLVVRPGPAPIGESRFRVGRVVLATLAGFVAICVVAASVNGGKTMKTANTRWPVWTWSSGPFPGR